MREKLIAFYNLHQEIGRVEKSIFNTEFYEGNGFVWFEKLRTEFYKAYYESVEPKSDFTLLEWVEEIMEYMETFDFGLLTPDERKEITDEQGNLSIFNKNMEKFPHAIIKFKDLNEVLDYVLSKNV